MFIVSNRNTRKRCLLISKITLQTSERSHLTTSYLSEITVQNHVLDSFLDRINTNLQSKFCFQFCFQVRRLVISTIVDHICHFMRNEKSLPKYLIHEKFKMSGFFISEKSNPKNWNIFQLFTLYSKVVISVSQS